MTVQETFKVEAKGDKYEVSYTSVEEISAMKLMSTFQQLERSSGELKMGLQEFEPHITAARRVMAEQNISLLELRLKEIEQSDLEISEEAKKEIIEQNKKRIEQTKFDIRVMEPENLETRIEQINKQIKVKELRLKELRPHVNSAKLKIRKEEEKRKRMAKKDREKAEKRDKDDTRIVQPEAGRDRAKTLLAGEMPDPKGAV